MPEGIVGDHRSILLTRAMPPRGCKPSIGSGKMSIKSLFISRLGTPEKRNRELARIQPNTMAYASHKHGYPVTSDSVVSSSQMFLTAIQRQPGHYQVKTKVKIVAKMMRRSLRIFSAHITRNAMDIEVSAPLASRGIINFRA